MKAIMTGSFDPITLGHVEIAKKASKFFDELYVVALLNSEKEYMFSFEEKKEFMRLSLQNVENVIIDAYDGFTADYMHKHGITKIVRGIRGELDKEYEEKLAEAMKGFDKDFETIFIESDEEFSNISSTYARELLAAGKSLDGVIAVEAQNAMLEALKLKRILTPNHIVLIVGKSNNYDLITRVKVTDTAPASPQDVVAIHDNPPLTEDYKKAIYEWSKDNNKRGINNWVAVQVIWDALNNRG